jgi:hypothetical protein
MSAWDSYAANMSDDQLEAELARLEGLQQPRALATSKPALTIPVVVSYGGGLDSFCMLVEGVKRGERIDAVAFVDVGNFRGDAADPGEWSSTYRHIVEVAIPFLAKHGIPVVWIDAEGGYPVRDATSLYEWLRASKQIPMSGPSRICTIVAKVERFEKWLTDHFPNQDVIVWIGFEAGEEARAAKDPNTGKRKVEPEKAKAASKRKAKPESECPVAPPSPSAARRINRFPLIEWGLCRCRCALAVSEEGYAVPRKSACVFCPYGTKGDWQTLQRQEPKQFEMAHRLEVDKPPTIEAGKKLSIMGYRSIKDKAGNEIGYKAPQLPQYVLGVYKPAIKPCRVCGQRHRATKATGNDYLPASDLPEPERPWVRDEREYLPVFLSIGKRDVHSSDLRHLFKSLVSTDRFGLGKVRVLPKHSIISVREDLLDKMISKFHGSTIGGKVIRAEMSLNDEDELPPASYSPLSHGNQRSAAAATRCAWGWRRLNSRAA